MVLSTASTTTSRAPCVQRRHAEGRRGGRPALHRHNDLPPDPDLSTNAAISRDHLRRFLRSCTPPRHCPAESISRLVEQINAGSSSLRGLERVRSDGSWSMRLNKSGGWSNCCRMAGSPLDLQGDFTRQEVWAAPISALVRVSRRLAVPSACVGVAELLQVSDHVASVYSPVPPPTPRALSPLRTPEYARDISRCRFLLTVSFLHHKQRTSSAASRLLTAIHTPPAFVTRRV
jgi:hypothetical protein